MDREVSETSEFANTIRLCGDAIFLCKNAKKNRKTPAISDALRFFSFRKGRHLGRREKDWIPPQILAALSILAGSQWVAIFRNRQSLMATPVYWQCGLLRLDARCSVVSAMRPQQGLISPGTNSDGFLCDQDVDINSHGIFY